MDIDLLKLAQKWNEDSYDWFNFSKPLSLTRDIAKVLNDCSIELESKILNKRNSLYRIKTICWCFGEIGTIISWNKYNDFQYELETINGLIINVNLHDLELINDY